MDVSFDSLMRLVIRMRHYGARRGRLCVGVGDIRAESAGHVILNGTIKSTAGCPIGVNDFLFTGFEFVVVIYADDVFAKLLKMSFQQIQDHLNL